MSQARKVLFSNIAGLSEWCRMDVFDGIIHPSIHPSIHRMLTASSNKAYRIELLLYRHDLAKKKLGEDAKTTLVPKKSIF